MVVQVRGLCGNMNGQVVDEFKSRCEIDTSPLTDQGAAPGRPGAKSDIYRCAVVWSCRCAACAAT